MTDEVLGAQLPQTPGQEAGGCQQHMVTSVKPIGIVINLKIVEVDIDGGKRFLLALVVTKLGGNHFFSRQGGQWIGVFGII